MDRAKKKIEVLVVEDSRVAQMSLVQILHGDLNVQVIGVAENGGAALRFMSRRMPSVVLMDIHMPEMDGLEATRQIMRTLPVPIVICSCSISPREAATTFRSMEAGAVACVEKPPGREHRDFPAAAAHLLQTVKLMSEVKVVHRWARSNRAIAASPPIRPMRPSPAAGKIEVIGIGASTGGPPVIQTILKGLPPDFAAPLLIVQHIAAGFLGGLAEWLSRTTGFMVHIAEHQRQPLAGHVYLAPDDLHMGIDREGRIALSGGEQNNGLRPSVTHLFNSLADFRGSSAVGVLLTGMGKDGADGLKHMKDRGSATIVQDRETSVVHGMPGEAIAIGAAGGILPDILIAPALLALTNQQSIVQGGIL